MTRQPKLILSLTGGLGNQLFQLAAGIKFSNGNLITVSTRYGRPRKNNKGNTEILSFYLPEQVVTDKPDISNRFMHKIAGYVLRVGVTPRKFENNIFFNWTLRLFALIAFTIERRQITHVYYSKDIGYYETTIKSPHTLLFGYFQTYIWANDPVVKQNMMSICSREGTDIIDEYKNLAEIEKPLVVHVRLGDYLNEKNFGIPSKNYYQQGITYLLSRGQFSRIWLFSDNIEMAQKYISEAGCGNVRLFSQNEYSTAVTFEIMRLGFGYVIANSSFSWWAAFLCKNSNVQVVVPDPWFVKIPEPNKLIPENWKRIKSK